MSFVGYGSWMDGLIESGGVVACLGETTGRGRCWIFNDSTF